MKKIYTLPKSKSLIPISYLKRIILFIFKDEFVSIIINNNQEYEIFIRKSFKQQELIKEFENYFNCKICLVD